MNPQDSFKYSADGVWSGALNPKLVWRLRVGSRGILRCLLAKRTLGMISVPASGLGSRGIGLEFQV